MRGNILDHQVYGITHILHILKKRLNYVVICVYNMILYGSWLMYKSSKSQFNQYNL